MTRIILLYVYIPIVLFLVGWTKWWIAVICLIAILYGPKKFLAPKDKGLYKDITEIKKATVIIAIFILLFFTFLIGWGGFTEQAGDFQKHNAILNDLVCRPWPVYYRNNYYSSDIENNAFYKFVARKQDEL